MSIPAACSCGKQVNAPDHLAGKRVKCPACGQPLEIPQPHAMDDGLGGLLDEAGMGGRPACPSCKEPLPNADAVLCLSCGYHLEKGKRIKGVASAAGGHEGVTDALLRRAEQALEDTPVQAEGAYGNRSQEWIIFAVMAGVAAGVVAFGVWYFSYMEKRYEDAKKAKEGGAMVAPLDWPARG